MRAQHEFRLSLKCQAVPNGLLLGPVVPFAQETCVLLKTSSCFSASISFHFLLQAIAGDIGLGHRLPSLHTLFAPVVSPSCGGGSFAQTRPHRAIADELRRQADVLTDLAGFRSKLSRARSARGFHAKLRRIFSLELARLWSLRPRTLELSPRRPRSR